MKSDPNNQDDIINPPIILLDCPLKYLSSNIAGNSKTNCELEHTEPACSYYKVIYRGKERTGLLQFDNICSLCTAHKEKGNIIYRDDEISVTHLGFENTPCRQGMYSPK